MISERSEEKFEFTKKLKKNKQLKTVLKYNATLTEDFQTKSDKSRPFSNWKKKEFHNRSITFHTLNR